MPNVTCRCGEKLKVPAESPEHMGCSRCGARIRLRRGRPKGNTTDSDGFIRFLCPCGRRLKVTADGLPKAGRCPDCGRVVPVPTSALGTLALASDKNETETRTQVLDAADLAELKKWSEHHLITSGQLKNDSAKARPATVASGAKNDEFWLPSNAIPRASVVKFETGLRICPRCKKPLHLSADNCRECGMPVPRD
jgi:hypothetical protein